MAQLDREAAVDRLHRVALEAFVEERKRLARELRSAGDHEAAAEVAGWPKPSPAAWALNHLVHEEADAVGEWLAAAAALRAASEGAGGDLRAAMAEHRSATLGLVETVRGEARPSGRPLSGAMLERVRALLQAATADPSLTEALRAGRIVEERDEDVAVAQPVPQAPAKPADARGGKRERAGATKPAERGQEPADPRRARRERADAAKREREAAARAELERRVEAASQEAERLRAEAKRCAEASESADERLEEAERALRRSKSEAKAARAAAKDAATSLANAERDLERLRARR